MGLENSRKKDHGRDIVLKRYIKRMGGISRGELSCASWAHGWQLVRMISLQKCELP
jgi:hypothetical protein